MCCSTRRRSRSVKLESRKTLDLIQFVDLGDIDPIYFDKPYYVVPADDLAEEAFVVLRDALQADAARSASASWRCAARNMSSALKPCGRGMVLETLRYADEVNRAAGYFREIGDAKPDADLLDLAETLIEKKTGDFDAKEFHNRYVDALKKLIAEKQKKKGKKVIQDPTTAGRARARNVIDLMAALKKSLGDDKQARSAAEEARGAKRRAAPAKKTRRRASGRKPMARAAKLDIDTYNRKRDFSKTAEPKGRKLKGKGDSFVVQKHDASRLHWDFRLELDGVLKSWAVPKGPTLDPDDKRLAVHVPRTIRSTMASFEGTIPKGEYGGGTVMLWDHGRWIPEPGKDPRKTIEEGHLHFTLEGERMKGEWVMFRLKPQARREGRAVDAEEGRRRIRQARRGRRAGRANA